MQDSPLKPRVLPYPWPRSDSSGGIVRELATKLSWAVATTLHVGYGRKSYLRKRCESWAEQLYDRQAEFMDSSKGSRKGTR